MAGTFSLPSRNILYRWCTPVVVSSDKPLMPTSIGINTGAYNDANTRTLEVLGVLVVDKGCKVPAVVKNQVERLVVVECSDSLVNAPEVLLLSLALPGEDWDASGSNT
jgi:hypothetical protein